MREDAGLLTQHTALKAQHRQSRVKLLLPTFAIEHIHLHLNQEEAVQGKEREREEGEIDREQIEKQRREEERVSGKKIAI